MDNVCSSPLVDLLHRVAQLARRSATLQVGLSLIPLLKHSSDPLSGNVGKTVSGATSGLGKTVGNTSGAIGRGDVSGVASGATGGVGSTVDGVGKGAVSTSRTKKALQTSD